MSEQPIGRFEPREFGGDYEAEDVPKFRGDLAKVRTFLMSNPNVWFTKLEIARGAGLTEGTDSSPRIRDLRKAKFGGHVIDTEKISGKYRYRLVK